MAQPTIEAEVDRNFDAFLALAPKLLKDHEGQFALMRKGEIADFYPTESQALYNGKMRYEDNIFSVQEVTQRPVDLGFFSHAIDTRLA